MTLSNGDGSKPTFRESPYFTTIFTIFYYHIFGQNILFPYFRAPSMHPYYFRVSPSTFLRCHTWSPQARRASCCFESHVQRCIFFEEPKGLFPSTTRAEKTSDKKKNWASEWDLPMDFNGD